MTALVKLRRLVGAATPQPWRQAAIGPNTIYPDPSTHPGIATAPRVADARSTRDAALIVEAVNLLPAFLDLWEAAQRLYVDGSESNDPLFDIRAVLDRLDAIEEKKP